MLGRIGSHLRANLIGYLALMVALGGTSYAAVNLPANSVGTKQLKAKSVATPKLKANAVSTAKIKPRAVTAGKLAPGAVPAATNVIDLVQEGAVNPLPQPYTTILEAPGVAPGNYLIQAKAIAINFGSGDFTRCQIRIDGVHVDQSNTFVSGAGTPGAELTTMAAVSQDAAFDVDLACGHDSAATNPYIEGSRLQVIRVDSIE